MQPAAAGRARPERARPERAWAAPGRRASLWPERRPAGPGLTGGDRGGGGLPIGTQRHVGFSAGFQPDAENLVEFDDVALESKARARHVQPPHPGGARPDLGDGLVPVGIQVRAPAGERARIMLAQVLLVPDLETRA